MKKHYLATLIGLGLTSFAHAEDKPPAAPATKPAIATKVVDTSPAAPKALPGKGLAEHDFLYAGEAKDRRVYIVRKGEVVWSYDDPQGKGEISDAALLSNGNPSSMVPLTGTLTVVMNANGDQVAYNGHLLYRFAGDKAKGDATGEGLQAFGGVWKVATPSLTVAG